MKSERHLVQSVEVDRVLIDHASFRLCRPFDSHHTLTVGKIRYLLPDSLVAGSVENAAINQHADVLHVP
jgi:hypothetical protein